MTQMATIDTQAALEKIAEGLTDEELEAAHHAARFTRVDLEEDETVREITELQEKAIAGELETRKKSRALISRLIDRDQISIYTEWQLRGEARLLADGIRRDSRGLPAGARRRTAIRIVGGEPFRTVSLEVWFELPDGSDTKRVSCIL